MARPGAAAGPRTCLLVSVMGLLSPDPLRPVLHRPMQGPQDRSPSICRGSSFPPTPSTQHCTAPCRAHICSALYSGSSDGTYWILPTFLHVWSKLAAIPKPPHQSLGPLYASLASLHARPSAIQLGLRLSPSSPRKASILGAEMGNKQRT